MTRTNAVVTPSIPPEENPAAWPIANSAALYGVRNWGQGYFDINEAGHVTVHPNRQATPSVDLKELVDQLGIRGIHAPVLIRFTDILRHRVQEIAGAFRKAITENEYKSGYTCVYPIKVNQQRHVVEEIAGFASEQGFGLEAGSKPELLAVLALTNDKDIPIICNGFKDDEFIEMVILAQKIGKRVIPVVEKFDELELLVKYAEIHAVMPVLGVRVKLSAKGAGRWEASGGVRSKFGLFVSEVVDALEYLKSRGMAQCLKLVHCHLGSQINNIRNVKEAVTELARVYVALHQAGGGLEYIDIGGGLGVDYDGSQSDNESSINYSLNEYANDVVFRIKSICDEVGVPHPNIISESGRALVAYHSVLVFNVVGVAGFDSFNIPDKLPTMPEGEHIPQPIIDLFDLYRELTREKAVEYYHDAATAYDAALNLFKLGYLDLNLRALAEKLYWATCNRIFQLTAGSKRVPKELKALPGMLLDTYFCNFSIFQSMPDSWAIDQRFPIMPIHRLNEKPDRRGILADITCDSDGKIDNFIDNKNSLELHTFKNGEDYLMGVFLVGAYQEILGDLHNLFGDTHAVHVSIEDDGHASIEHVIQGDTVREVLDYVEFDADELLGRMRKDAEKAVRANRLSLAECAQFMKFFEKGLNGYTYLEEPSDG
jgi:arginine decarboxylase